MSGARFHLTPARGADDIAAASALFGDYAAGLGVDLWFQDFSTELATLPGKYAPPQGELLLGRDSAGGAIGCVALRPLDERGVGEIKRLYVRPAARGLGLGKALAMAILETAASRGYREVKLDTLAAMTEALALYRRLGFVEIPAYYANPLPGTRYLGKRLVAD